MKSLGFSRKFNQLIYNFPNLYLHGSSIWDATPSNRDATPSNRYSPIWRSILNVRDYMKDNIKWAVGSSSSIPIRSNWIPYQQFWNYLLSLCPFTITVSSLMDRSGSSWCVVKLQQLNINHQLYIVINKIHQDMPDSIIWTKTGSGKFSVRSVYQESRLSNQHIPFLPFHLLLSSFLDKSGKLTQFFQESVYLCEN